MAQPTFYVVAGPNGSGKTTFALNDPALKSIPFINADIEAERLSPGSPARAALAAGRKTLSHIAREIAARTEFALETTLSGHSTLAAIRQALAAGYAIDFTYICLSSPSLNVARVSRRVVAGGHHVPEEDILRRYSRSLQNLPAALALAERARVFDNTRDGKPRPILEIREQRVFLVQRVVPDWLIAALRMETVKTDAAQHIETYLEECRKGRR